MRYANATLPSDARILFVFMGKRGYYCDRPYRLDGVGRSSLLMRTVMGSRTPGEIAARLSGAGITHMMLQTDIFSRWVNEDFDAGKRALFKAFLRRYTALIYSHRLYGLVALSPRGNAGVDKTGPEERGRRQGCSTLRGQSICLRNSSMVLR